jgi:ATP-dependent 26S proteasome regulatory subunit
MASDQERDHALASFKQKLIESREWETKLKNLRLEIKGLQTEFDQTEDNIKALQSVGQIIGEVLKQLDDERCAFPGPSIQPQYLSAQMLTFTPPPQSSSRPRPGHATSSGAGPRSTRPR